MSKQKLNSKINELYIKHTDSLFEDIDDALTEAGVVSPPEQLIHIRTALGADLADEYEAWIEDGEA